MLRARTLRQIAMPLPRLVLPDRNTSEFPTEPTHLQRDLVINDG